MNEQDVFVIADRALSSVVSKIRDDQWDMKLPKWFQVGRTQNSPSLRDIINYHAYDDAWVPDVVAGKTLADVGDTFDGDLLGKDPKRSFANLVEIATAAVVKLNDLDSVVHLSYGDFPARDYLKHVTSFRGLRVYDISKLIGADTTMLRELVAGLWDELRPEADAWRKMGVFGPEVIVPNDSPLQDKLLALTGRDPRA